MKNEELLNVCEKIGKAIGKNEFDIGNFVRTMEEGQLSSFPLLIRISDSARC